MALIEVVTITEDTELAVEHNGKLLQVDSASPVAITVPEDPDFEEGMWVDIEQVGDGAVTIVDAATVNASSDDLSVPYKNSVVHLRCRGSNVWSLYNGAPAIGQWSDWSPVFTGFSVAPTYLCRYSKIGKICNINFRITANGTSNATSKTVTLPFVANKSTVIACLPLVNNNTAEAGGVVVLTAGSDVATIARMGGTNWTNSGNAGFSFSGSYETE